MDNNLTFVETVTVEQFKAAQHVDKIEIKPMARKNPDGTLMKDANGKTMFYGRADNRMFFTFGTKTGAVSRNGIPSRPMISLVKDSSGGSFYLMHEEGTGGAPVLATF